MFDKSKNFYLKGDLQFNDRQKNVFEELDRMSSKQPENRVTEDEVKFKSRKLTVDPSRKELKSFVGKESIFKRPDIPLQKRSTKLNLPDFVKNPHKWKRYKLDDEEMSDKSNRAVAMAFLEEIRQRKMDTDGEPPPPDKIKFNRNFKEKDGEELAQVDFSEKPSFVNGKLTMPEYVIGQKIKKAKNVDKPRPKATQSCVKLDHLTEEEFE
ncbi:uncharacterized protein LOC106665899 [Cimex lectularius]|uniref:U5 small nuclear ribonucleoprotein TSSC4 n=1 Tax=Cimex lectularius TaxID=79782 RepID=A0A8I6RUA3_CIMLE|nr:uncharacterized protein LOC106665899 [Cimex lectularius]